MSDHFRVIKRTFENDAIIVFIDLLGTRALYDSGLTEYQAQSILRTLLSQFSLSFSEYFKEDEIEQNFDTRIFGDSIVVSQRKGNSALVKLLDFSMGYQTQLLQRGMPSRVTIVRDSFFSLRLLGASKTSILNSQYTTVSLCGGKGIKVAHDGQKGLPIGVYVAEGIMNDLTAEQQKRAIPVKKEKWFFIKQKYDLLAILPDLSRETFLLLNNDPDASTAAIRRALNTSHPDKDALEKFMPWVLVHLGRQNKIHRRTNKCVRVDRGQTFILHL